MEELHSEEAAGSSELAPEADTVYLLMKSQIPISRTSRVKWLLDRLNTVVRRDVNVESWDDAEQEFKVLSVIADSTLNLGGAGKSQAGRLVSSTKVNLLAGSYRMVFCLDMSPSQCTVDLPHGEILLDELFRCLERSIRGLSEPVVVEGCSLIPDIYVTVIAHTPFFMSPAQQVLVKGVHLGGEGLDELLRSVAAQLRHLSQRIADVAGTAHDRLEQQTSALLDEDLEDAASSNIPMVSPDANFVNMLRYSMLALSLLPEFSLSSKSSTSLYSTPT